MAGRIGKWARQQVLALRCGILNRQLIRMRLDGRIRLLEMAREN
jgi:hypothetical protein